VIDGDDSLLARIAHVEVRRFVVGVVHLYDNTEETADLGHVRTIIALSQALKVDLLVASAGHYVVDPAAQDGDLYVGESGVGR
jgi:hypothetical protein